VAERAIFLDDLIVTLIENFRTLTWFRTEAYDCPDDGPVTATIVDDGGTRHSMTRDTMSRGIDVIRRARLAPARDLDGGDLHRTDGSDIAECALYGQVVYASASPTNATTTHRPPGGAGAVRRRHRCPVRRPSTSPRCARRAGRRRDRRRPVGSS